MKPIEKKSGWSMSPLQWLAILILIAPIIFFTMFFICLRFDLIRFD